MIKLKLHSFFHRCYCQTSDEESVNEDVSEIKIDLTESMLLTLAELDH